MRFIFRFLTKKVKSFATWLMKFCEKKCPKFNYKKVNLVRSLSYFPISLKSSIK
jgi:hypothetical protein